MKLLFSVPLFLLLAGCQSGLPSGQTPAERISISENFDMELIPGTALQPTCDLVPAGRAAYSNEQGYVCVEFLTEDATHTFDIAGHMQENDWELATDGPGHNWYHWQRRNSDSETCELIAFSQADRFEPDPDASEDAFVPTVLLISHTETADCLLDE